jgi:hypothetical protein
MLLVARIDVIDGEVQEQGNQRQSAEKHIVRFLRQRKRLLMLADVEERR